MVSSSLLQSYFSFLNYEQYKMSFKKLSVIEVLYDHLSCYFNFF